MKNVSAQWQTIYKDSAHYQFNTVYFLNNDTGFVGGYDFTSNNNGVIFRTKDGGQTWDTTKLDEIIICVQFINDSFGFCGGDGGADYLTTDVGDTWQVRGFSTTLSDHSSIYFLNPSNGYRSTMQSWIQKTIDTGMTWQNIFNSTGGSFFPGTSRMVFTDSLHGYLAQSRFGQAPNGIKSITKTSDGGTTWTDLNIPTYFYPYSCFFFDSISGFAVGKYGAISKTSDGGQNWTTPFSISNYVLYDIAFVNDTIGYIVGGFNQYDTTSIRKGIIFQTINGGVTWQVMDSSYYDGLIKLHFPSDSVGYAVGFNGIILKITNANSVFTSIEPISFLNKDFTIYPNPASEILNVKNAKTENITIANYLGEVMLSQKVIHNRINISFLNTGIYFLKAGSEVLRFVKQ